ncbi:MAG: septum site-determining protein MinD [Clostridia bacterium]
MGKVTVVTSGKGGVGKTTTTANLGAALAMRGKRVLLIDTDIGLRNLDIAMGMESGIVYDLVDVVNEVCDFKKAVLRHRDIEGLYLLPAAQTKDKSAVTRAQIKNLLRKLRPEYDFILIDCPAGIEQGFENAVAGADSAIVVTVPELSGIRDADRVIGLLEKQELTDMTLVINRMRPALIKKGLMPDVEDVLSYLSINLLGAVPEDEKIVIAANTIDLVAPDLKSEAGRAYRNMAARLCGEKVDLINFKEKKGFLRRLFE